MGGVGGREKLGKCLDFSYVFEKKSSKAQRGTILKMGVHVPTLLPTHTHIHRMVVKATTVVEAANSLIRSLECITNCVTFFFIVMILLSAKEVIAGSHNLHTSTWAIRWANPLDQKVFFFFNSMFLNNNF